MFQLQPVTYKNIEKCIKMKRNDYSAGCDHIPAFSMKSVSEFLLSPITFMIKNFIKINFQTYRNSLESVQFWKCNCQWNFKTTDQYSFYQYQRFTRVVLEQIINFIGKKLTYHHYHTSYCKNHSTATLFAKLRIDIKKAIKANEIALAVLTDYSKAFDTIDFTLLIKKMHTLNFSKRLLCWIFSYLTDLRHFVQIDSNISNILYINFDVPQGSILGSVLLNLCAADRKNILDGSECIQYAYDSTIYRSCKIKDNKCSN